MADVKQMSLKLPADLYEQAKEEADRGELSVHAWIIEAVKSKLRGGEVSESVERPKPLGQGVPFIPNSQRDRRIVGYTWDKQPIYDDERPGPLQKGVKREKSK